jgi:Maltokinase N-terminal cap domain
VALIHRATLQPTKAELIADWLPRQPWYVGPALTATDVEQLGAFRFDDPGGEVGLQVLLVRIAGQPTVHQVPLTYRPAPLDRGADGLITEMEHSVLGRRWVYDACHDPVFIGELVRATLTGGTEADEVVEDGGELVGVPKTVRAHGTGAPGADVPGLRTLEVEVAGSDTVVRSGPVLVTLHRVLDDRAVAETPALVAEWQGGRAVLATVTVGAGAHHG